MKLPVLLIAFALATVPSPLSAQAAPRVTTPLSGAQLVDLEAVRTAVWVDWFSGDTAALRRVLGPELVAISAGVPRPQSLSESLAASAAFKAQGGKFISVSFDATQTHQIGATAVMFSRYTVVMEQGGERKTLTGRATEVFVRSNGRWVHTSWHLDEEGA